MKESEADDEALDEGDDFEEADDEEVKRTGRR